MLERFFRRFAGSRLGAAPQAPGPTGYDYFDETYFQDGDSKGTAYRDYLRSSRSSLICAEIAQACAALKPRRALEIGCATGVIVDRLNGMGIEAHGVDVSEWAIKNREHRRVVLAGAESLPYPDGWFDLVYSVHALEHLPEAVADAAFAEIARVSAPDAVQFHTLPILGIEPYGYGAVTWLRRDRTHHLLYDEAWWLARFAQIGFVDVGAHLLFQNEDRADLSVSQLLLARPDGVARRLAQARLWNGEMSKRCALARAEAHRGIHRPLIRAASPWLALPGRWADVDADADFVIDDETVFTAVVALDADAPTMLRFCFLSGEGDETDHIHVYPPGVTTFQFRRRDLLQRLGSAAQVRKVVFGGEGSGRAQVSLIAENNGAAVFEM